ncbi:hypothetical protein CR205_16850 [Alteribacter lacisalsi]|uniref:Uncharacterized protein n=1 Tax=Alteribacter lacisalsi TaxID=2045244 RepID=A0A2W0H7G8_9BACI|nr:hypothetical protein CR205_16850 [Alteribacter lacisalsi]
MRGPFWRWWLVQGGIGYGGGAAKTSKEKIRPLKGLLKPLKVLLKSLKVQLRPPMPIHYPPLP